jgi:hypothetical protein
MAQYLTFWIDSDSTAGELIVTGNFDVGFGFIFDQGPKASSHFAAAGVTLKQLAGDGNSEFRISIRGKSGFDFSNHRFFLKFVDPNNNKFNFQTTGGVNLRDPNPEDTIFVRN